MRMTQHGSTSQRTLVLDTAAHAKRCLGVRTHCVLHPCGLFDVSLVLSLCVCVCVCVLLLSCRYELRHFGKAYRIVRIGDTFPLDQ